MYSTIAIDYNFYISKIKKSIYTTYVFVTECTNRYNLLFNRFGKILSEFFFWFSVNSLA